MNCQHISLFTANIFLLLLSLTSIAADRKILLKERLQQKRANNLEKHLQLSEDRIQLSENLIYACHGNNTAQAIQLIKSGADVNYQANIELFGFLTPLHIACMRKNTTVANALIDHGADPSCMTAVKNGLDTQTTVSPWLIVCEQGCIDIGEYMIQKFPNIIFSCSQSGYSGLHKSIQNKQSKMTEKIIAVDRRKILINKQTAKSLLTPFAIAAINNDIDSMNILLKNGALIDNPYSPDHVAPILHAIIKDNFQLAEYLLKNGANPNIVFKASYLEICCVTNRSDMGKLLIDYGAHIDAATKQGVSLLCIAVLRKNVSFLKMLLDAGADKSIKASQSVTLLNCIESVNDPEITQLLEEKGIYLISQNEAEIKKGLFFEGLNQNSVQDKTLISTTETKPSSNLQIKERNAKVVQTQKKTLRVLQSQPIPNNNQKEVKRTPQKILISSNPIKYIILQDKNLKWPRSLSAEQEQNLRNCIKELQYMTELNENVTSLSGKLKGQLRLRVGDHRVIFSVNHERREVIIHTIKLRKNVYK